MNNSEEKSASPSGQGGDGVHIIEHGKRGLHTGLLYKLLALVLVGFFVFYVVKMTTARTRSEHGSADLGESVSGESKSASTDVKGLAASSSETQRMRHREITARSAQTQSDRNDLSNYVAPGQAPKMEEVIARLHAAGVHEGLGAFNPPGTSPPMLGLAVPEDYVLPEGYVRHFQATDDGQRIEPILMFSPDFDFFDSAGMPIAIPENRVVPANMAPPGLAIRPINIPAPLEPGKP